MKELKFEIENHINNILITDIINNELELLSNYSKRAKEHKTLIKTNDKKKKM